MAPHIGKAVSRLRVCADERIERVREVRGRVPAFSCTFTSAGDTRLSLTADEVARINVTTNVDTHVMEMSEGVIEEDRVTVIHGPFKGHEARIARVGRAQAPGMGGYGHVWTTQNDSSQAGDCVQEIRLELKKKGEGPWPSRGI